MNYRLFSVVFLVPFFYFNPGGVADDVSSKEKIIAYLKLGKSNKEIAELCDVSVRTVERYKKNLTTSDNDTKNDKRQNDRIKREQAKILVEEGATIREVSDKVGLPRSTVGDISSKENLQQSQLEYLKEFRNNQRKKIRENKLKRLMLNDEILEAVEYELSNWQENGRVSKAAIEKLLMSEELEQKIFESDRIERLERFELEKAKKVKKANLPPAYFDDMDQELDNEE